MRCCGLFASLQIVVSEVIKEMAQTKSLATNVFSAKDPGATEDGAAAGKTARPTFKGMCRLLETHNMSRNVVNKSITNMSEYFAECIFVLSFACVKHFHILHPRYHTVLILTEVDNLSMLAQQALRRTMEK